METFRSVPPYEIIENQIYGFRQDLGLWFQGIFQAAEDPTLPFGDHCYGCDVKVREAAEKLHAFLGRCGNHRLSREHRNSAQLVREYLQTPPLPHDVGVPTDPPLPPLTLHAWQREMVRLKRGLREVAAEGMKRRAKKGKNRSQLQITVPRDPPQEEQHGPA